jgi:hypothetical protein
VAVRSEEQQKGKIQEIVDLWTERTKPECMPAEYYVEFDQKVGKYYDTSDQKAE